MRNLLKQSLSLLLCSFVFLNVFSQKKAKEAFYLFDKSWNPVSKQEDAIFFGKMTQLSDTAFVWDEYNYMGPKIRSLTYMDEKQEVLHGHQVIYRASGYIDSAGDVSKGKLTGDWVYLNDTGAIIYTKTYNNGKLIHVKDHLKDVDSAKNAGKSYDDEKESEFPGGIQKWQRYLIKNLTYPDRAVKANVMGKVILVFIVNVKGGIESIELLKSVEYSIDEEAIRLIKNSPDWTPAFQNGKHVKSYKKQPLVFRF